MMHRLVVAVALCALTFAALATGAVAVAASAAASYIVVLTPTAKVNTVLKNNQVSPTNVYHAALNGFAAPLTDDQVNRLRADPTVMSVTPDVTLFGFTGKPAPPPPTQGPQSVKNHVLRVGGLLSPTAHIDGVDERVDIDVAILDSGIQPDNPDLNVLGGVDCSNGNKGWADDNGHGTMVAGVTGAVDNTIGVVGIAPGARLWAVKVLKKNNTGSNANIICGVDWVTAHANVIDVANMSLAGKGTDTGNCGLDPGPAADPLHQAICASVAAGVTYVVAAGNESKDASAETPAAYPEVITVSAMTARDVGPASCLATETDDTFATFSNFGANVDLAAPGVCIVSTYIGSIYAFASGTSFSAPIVSAAAALYKATHSSATPAQVRAALISLEEPGPIPGDPDAYPEGIVNISTL